MKLKEKEKIKRKIAKLKIYIHYQLLYKLSKIIDSIFAHFDKLNKDFKLIK